MTATLIAFLNIGLSFHAPTRGAGRDAEYHGGQGRRPARSEVLHVTTKGLSEPDASFRRSWGTVKVLQQEEALAFSGRGFAGKTRMAKRTTHRSSAGKKLYAVRDASGKFKDIQTYERAHRQDLKRKSASELRRQQRRNRETPAMRRTRRLFQGLPAAGPRPGA